MGILIYGNFVFLHLGVVCYDVPPSCKDTPGNCIEKEFRYRCKKTCGLCDGILLKYFTN